MFVLLWTILLFAVRSNSANAVAYPEATPEITAEAGLCVVIPCNFTTDPGFPLESAVWYKCEQNCSDSDIILHLNDTNRNARPGFRGRVSLLEPDLSKRNCSIIISDLTKSDSGSYQLKPSNGTKNTSHRATINVKDLIHKPSVIFSHLTEGQQTTLTCTAPGLCSGPAPKITWTWRGAGANNSHITGNITDFKTEKVTAVTQRYSSTLTFNASVIHHGTSVTCKVSFTNNITTEETVNLNVTYVKKPEISGITTVKQGDTLNLTCSFESFPPSVITWTKLNLNKKLTNGTGRASLVIPNTTAEMSGQYTCTAKHLNNTLRKEVNITVIYLKKSEITGERTVKEGNTLNLTCNIESSPPAHVMWTVPSNKNLHKGTGTNTGTATLVIPNVIAEHTGQYICTAKHLDMTVTTLYANVTVTSYPTILSSSECISQSEVLTCMCVTEGIPLPTIKWPLLKNHTVYSVITMVSNHTVNSTVILPAKDQSNTVVECVSSNKNREVKRNLVIKKVEQQQEEGQHVKFLNFVTQLEVIIVFLIGALLSAIICCLARKCHRKKQRTSGNLAETLKMVTSHEHPLVDAGQAVEDDQAINQEAAEAEGTVADGKPDVEYSNLDFSLLKRESPEEAGTTQGTTETEYAEIKKEKDREGKEEVEMTGEDEATKHCVPDEEEGEDVALYSTVKDVMDQI